VPATGDPIDALNDPEQWPWAARELAARGDPSALPALVAAYDMRDERSRLPLLDAMEAVGGIGAVPRLAASPHEADRGLAARLAHLLPDAAHVPALERLVTDPDPGVAAEARAALHTQVRDARWRATVERLAHAEDPGLREAALSWQREG
jgi:hypothetical protein